MTSPFRISIQRRPGRGFGEPALLVATLALAIGANTVLFSIVNAFTLRPLPMAEPERVGFVLGTDTAQGDHRARVSLEDYLDLGERNRSFEELAAFRRGGATLTGGGEPERILVQQASASLFPAWSLEVLRGRPLRPEDDAPGAAPVALLAHRVWRDRHQSSEAILGQFLVLDGVAHTIVGVMPPVVEIGGLSQATAWIPLGAARGLEPRERRDLFVCGRLRDGLTHEQASAEVRTLSAQLRTEHPGTNSSWDGRVTTTREALVGSGTMVVLGFLGLVVTGVLVVACANVANILFASVARRRVDFATRAALGATGGRILRSLLGEFVAVALAAGLGGLLLAALGLRLIRTIAFDPVWSMMVIDVRVLSFAAALAAVALALASLFPARAAAKSDLRSLIDAGANRTTASRRLVRLRRFLAAAQLGAALVVVVPASLVGRSIAAELRAEWGFDGRPLTTAQITLPARRYGSPAARADFSRRLLANLATPPLAAAALVEPLPIFGRERIAGLEIPGVAAERPEDRPRAVIVGASPELFATLGVATLAGDGLPREVVPDTPIRVAVNRSFAARWLGPREAEAVGRAFSLADPIAAGRSLVVAAVVADVKSPDLTRPPTPTVYLPLEALAPESFAIVVRAPSGEQAAGAIRRAVAALDPGVALERPASYPQLHREDSSSNRVVGALFASFAAIAVLLALVGLYAVATFAVAQREREFGVRMALGADRRAIVRSVLFEGARIAAWGGGAGLLLGAGVAQLLQSRLYGVSPLDPLTFGGAALGLALFTVAVLTLPARRAAGFDPANLLRTS